MKRKRGETTRRLSTAEAAAAPGLASRDCSLITCRAKFRNQITVTEGATEGGRTGGSNKGGKSREDDLSEAHLRVFGAFNAAHTALLAVIKISMNC